MHCITKRNSPGFTPLEKAADFNRRSLPLKADGGLKPPSAQTVRERSSLTGFTLIEMLIVSVMVSVISLAIYATFNNGIKIWQRVNQPLTEEDLYIFFDRFYSDVKNSLNFNGLIFFGTEESLELTTLVDSPQLQKRTIGRVIYSYVPSGEVLNREQKDFSQIYNDEEGMVRNSVRNVKSLKFQYYFYDGNKKEYLWEDECLNGTLPLAVRIELELNNGNQTGKFTKTVDIPISS